MFRTTQFAGGCNEGGAIQISLGYTVYARFCCIGSSYKLVPTQINIDK